GCDSRLLLLEDGENVSRGIREPSDERAPAAEYAFVVHVGFHLGIAFELHAASTQVVDRFLNVVDGKIQDRKGRRRVIRFGVGEDGSVVAKVQTEKAVGFGDPDAEGFSVEFLGRGQVVNRKTTER